MSGGVQRWEKGASVTAPCSTPPPAVSRPAPPPRVGVPRWKPLAAGKRDPQEGMRRHVDGDFVLATDHDAAVTAAREEGWNAGLDDPETRARMLLAAEREGGT